MNGASVDNTRANAFEDRNGAKVSRGKAKSLDRHDSGLSSLLGNTNTASPYIQNLRSGIKPTVHQQQQYSNHLYPSNGLGSMNVGSINSRIGHAFDSHNVGLAKRGTINDDETFKSTSALQHFSARKPSAGRSNNSSHVTEKSNSGDTDGKIVTGIAVKTKAGALPGKPVKTNQDSYIIHKNFAGNKTYSMFAVCDGHGVNGHHVSGFVKQNLPRNIEAHFKSLNVLDDSRLREAITQGFAQTNKDLISSSIDVNFSGSTTVSVLILNDRIISANVGDSRAVMAKFKNNHWTAFPLSLDHKPDEKREMQRILSNGGRVESFKDYNGEPIGPARVWLKNENIPGLAMARSFGDAVARQVGVIAEPEIMEFQVQEEDKFMIIASDGVWEFLSNEQVMNYVVPFYLKNQLEAACDKLIRESTICWKQEDEVVDDITAIIVTLKAPPKN